MDTNIDILAAEVDRIVNSPYPTQLKTLCDIVSKTSDREIILWTKSYPCRIPTLAQALLDALPHWPYVFDIVTRLACASRIRDAILKIEPTLLDDVVTKASQPQAATKKFLELSIALLSTPLPHEISLPASSQSLFIYLFEQAVAQPEVATLKLILQLLQGSCRHLVGVLPLDILASLEDRLISIMRALTPVKNKTAAIYCLTIMKTILDESVSSSQPTPNDIWDNLDSSGSSQFDGHERWNLRSLARLFQSSRGLKTLTLITLQVIWACTSGMERNEPEATLTSATMANDILSSIAAAEREEWCRQNAGVILRKLQERCLVPDLSPALRLQALTFHGTIAGNLALPQQHVSAYEQILLDFNSICLSTNQAERVLRTSVYRFTPSLSTQWWEALVSTLLGMFIEPIGSLFLASSATVTSLLNDLMEVMDESSQSRQGLISALSSFRCRQKLDQFLGSFGHVLVPTEGTAYCSRELTACLDAMSTSFCALLLRSALAARPNEAQLPSALIPGILKRHASSKSSNIVCQSCTRRSPGTPSHSAFFVEVESTPEVRLDHLPWKERLAIDMQAQAKSQQQAIIASFTEICRDLESRCESVEAPLRKEQERFADLNMRHEQLNKAHGELEVQIMDRDLRINALEAESDSYQSQIEAATTETQDLLQRVEQAKEALQKANENARITLAEVQEEKHELELEHATTLACKQEALEEATENLRMSHHELQHLRSQMSHLEEGGRQNNVEHEKLRSNIHELERQLHDKQECLDHTEEEKKQIQEDQAGLQRDLDSLRKEVSDYRKQNEVLHANLEDVTVESKQEMEKTKSLYEETMNMHRQEWMKVKADLEQQLEQTRQELAQAEDGIREQQEANKQKTNDLRKKIDRLDKECHQKDAQIHEAQEMRNRLISAMGLAGAMPAGMGIPAMAGTMTQPSTKSSTLPYRSASTMATPNPSTQAILSTPAQRQEEGGNIERGEDSLDFDGMSDHGPTPKRSRPRQSLGRGNIGMHQPRQSLGSRTVKSVLLNRSAARRQPLLDVDINRSPSKLARSPSKVAFKAVENSAPVISTAEGRDMEDWSFSNADILTGTPGIALKDQLDYMDEESTADVA